MPAAARVAGIVERDLVEDIELVVLLPGTEATRWELGSVFVVLAADIVAEEYESDIGEQVAGKSIVEIVDIVERFVVPEAAAVVGCTGMVCWVEGWETWVV